MTSVSRDEVTGLRSWDMSNNNLIFLHFNYLKQFVWKSAECVRKAAICESSPKIVGTSESTPTQWQPMPQRSPFSTRGSFRFQWTHPFWNQKNVVHWSILSWVKFQTKANDRLEMQKNSNNCAHTPTTSPRLMLRRLLFNSPNSKIRTPGEHFRLCGHKLLCSDWF